MTSPAFILMAIAMVITLAALALGIFSMAKGGEFNEKYGNKLMQTRVICQGVAILFFILAFAAK